MIDNIQTYVQLFLNDVELNISVTNTLDAQKGNLKNFGYFQITDGGVDTKPVFYDNLGFFIFCAKKEFKKGMKKRLEKRGYDWKTTYKEIKTLLKRAKELNLIIE